MRKSCHVAGGLKCSRYSIIGISNIEMSTIVEISHLVTHGAQGGAAKLMLKRPATLKLAALSLERSNGGRYPGMAPACWSAPWPPAGGWLRPTLPALATKAPR